MHTAWTNHMPPKTVLVDWLNEDNERKIKWLVPYLNRDLPESLKLNESVLEAMGVNSEICFLFDIKLPRIESKQDVGKRLTKMYTAWRTNEKRAVARNEARAKGTEPLYAEVSPSTKLKLKALAKQLKVSHTEVLEALIASPQAFWESSFKKENERLEQKVKELKQGEKAQKRAEKNLNHWMEGNQLAEVISELRQAREETKHINEETKHINEEARQQLGKLAVLVSRQPLPLQTEDPPCRKDVSTDIAPVQELNTNDESLLQLQEYAKGHAVGLSQSEPLVLTETAGQEVTEQRQREVEPGVGLPGGLASAIKADEIRLPMSRRQRQRLRSRVRSKPAGLTSPHHSAVKAGGDVPSYIDLGGVNSGVDTNCLDTFALHEDVDDLHYFEGELPEIIKQLSSMQIYEKFVNLKRVYHAGEHVDLTLVSQLITRYIQIQVTQHDITQWDKLNRFQGYKSFFLTGENG